jgi:DeoR family glycerol-3-phosphate regulon repressor
VRIAHISQIQTFVTDAALPAGLANICHSRGIQVIEAMPNAGSDEADASDAEASDATETPSPVVRLR